MATILDYYKYAALATAAYVRMGEGPYSGARLATLAPAQSSGRLPTSIAQYLFAPTVQFPNPNPWTVARYFGRDVPDYNDDTGFAATLFKKDGENVLAIRGVEPTVSAVDAARDLLGASVGGIGLLGVAVNQLVDLVNLVLRLYGTGQVTQLRAEVTLVPPASGTPGTLAIPLSPTFIPSSRGLPPIAAPLFLSLTTYEAPGLGALAPGDKLTLTGHSLGGHLAVAAAPLLGNRINQDIYVFNSPGLDPVSVDVVAAGLKLFRLQGVTEALIFVAKTWLAESLGAGAELLPTESQRASGSILKGIESLLKTSSLAFTVHNLESEDSAPGDDQSVVASVFTGLNKLGQEQFVGTERNSHSIEQIMDALALQAVLYRLDNSLDLPTLKKFIDAAHYLPGMSEEVLVEALHALLIPGSRYSATGLQLAISDAGGGLNPWTGKGDIAARNEFHIALLEINRQLDSTGLGPTRVVSLVDVDAPTIEANAFGNIAYRFALRALHPFAVVGEDGIYDQHDQNGELEVYDPITGAGTLTSEWIADRAKFLTLKISRNTNDRLTELSTLSEAIWYQDLGLDENVYVMPSNLILGPGIFNSHVGIQAFLTKKLDAQRISFGSDDGESLLGGKKGDFLYGGGGNDHLSGLEGDDYLQGDAGDDVLDGGTENDTLFGGKGADILDGGLGNDIYVWNRGDGFDTISDAREADGLKAGTIQFLSETLAGNKTQVQADNSKLFTDERGILYALVGTPDVDGMLVVVKPGEEGGLQLTGFKNGDFGIVMPTPTVLPKTEKFGAAASDNSFSTQAGHEATLVADAPNQKVFGLDGNDRIIVAQPGAEAYGGPGGDYITNDSVEQKLFGEEGNDILVAAGGNDELYGGLGNDALQGGADDDYLDGDEGNDFLDGGTGSDVIVGGSGQDFILGGGNMVPAISEGEIDRKSDRIFFIFLLVFSLD